MNSSNINNNNVGDNSAVENDNKKSIHKISFIALLFGTGSWIAITGLWLEMPLLIQQLPEGWALASHLNIMIQFANIGPLTYWVANRYRVLNEISATHLQMWIGMLSCALLIFFWNQTMFIFNREHSLILFIATFGLALVDCTSSVTFLPFMARFDSSYLTPYLAGEGLSGFIPSMVALVQGVGEKKFSSSRAFNETSNTTQLIESELQEPKLIEPRFSVEVFFSALLTTLFISYLAFLCLRYLPICKREMTTTFNRRHSEKNHHKEAAHRESSDIDFEEGFELPQLRDNSKKDLILKKLESLQAQKKREQKCDKRTYYYLLALMGWNCFTTFGFMPSLQPYSALPYGTDILHYVVIMSGLAYPAGCFYGMLVEKKSVRLITFLTVLGSCIGVYIGFCALMSPSPPLMNSPIGGIVMICCWIAFVAILSYAKTMTTLVICDFNSSKGMFWVGMHTQFGAAIGALLIFVLINYTRFFNESSSDM